MAKFFDIKPPSSPKKTYHDFPNKSDKPRNKNKIGNILGFIIILVIVIIVFNFLNNNPSYPSNDNNASTLPMVAVSQSPSSTPTSPQENSESSDRISPNPSQNNSENKIQPKIIILNGGNLPEATNDAKKILETNSVNVSETGDAKNSYESTVIYFTNVNIDYANKIKDILITHSPKLIEDEFIATDGQIVIVIGDKN